MRIQRSDGQDTRQRLLKAAAQIFASKGYWKATLAEICNEADANVAAANYHFGGKETLYVESWRFSFENSLKKYPPNGGIALDAPVEEQLRARILSIMRRIIDPESHDFDIVHKEMASPTGLLTGSIQELIDPILEGFTAIIRDILGERATEKDVQLCRMSIRAQCFGPLLRLRRRMLASVDRPYPELDSTLQDVETLADHVTCFSLAGIRGVRARIEKKGT